MRSKTARSTKMEIYFDNGATTRAFPEVREMMDLVLEQE
jgi:cysteine sulfinate desulfinase/cysteine desulfurase-like protein